MSSSCFTVGATLVSSLTSTVTFRGGSCTLPSTGLCESMASSHPIRSSRVMGHWSHSLLLGSPLAKRRHTLLGHKPVVKSVVYLRVLQGV